ncbi:MAG: crossover junction endodeoxyribonuclease RuvC [Nisaea sp.]|jgi:crossover junction endodeoxyribonuclease RuvC|uniref:crossover junction endodeoxyribonuclease RuvC n=1 Tax=Nisaea sp. TaxID=2024842 RepID=UPI001B024D60|nr:crossover junction endodeoxyribonuclease RuvC [Nisaea sp.]MBO6562483.1 crossover junction endodeoxyribonuclease RuvC [Nisaea sp.]
MRLLGLDPGLRFTGWGVIDVDGNRLRHVANGTLKSTASLSIAERLLELHDGVLEIIERHRPDEAAVEETFVNKNPESTLKLGLARGAVLLAPAKKDMRVTEYAPNRVKKTVVGAGHANKDQIQVMVTKLLPDAAFETPDAADALAVAICHAHFAQSRHAFGDAVGVSRIRKQSATGGYEKAVQAALRKEMGL